MFIKKNFAYCVGPTTKKTCFFFKSVLEILVFQLTVTGKVKYIKRLFSIEVFTFRDFGVISCVTSY